MVRATRALSVGSRWVWSPPTYQKGAGNVNSAGGSPALTTPHPPRCAESPASSRPGGPASPARSSPLADDFRPAEVVDVALALLFGRLQAAADRPGVAAPAADVVVVHHRDDTGVGQVEE